MNQAKLNSIVSSIIESIVTESDSRWDISDFDGKQPVIRIMEPGALSIVNKILRNMYPVLVASNPTWPNKKVGDDLTFRTNDSYIEFIKQLNKTHISDSGIRLII